MEIWRYFLMNKFSSIVVTTLATLALSMPALALNYKTVMNPQTQQSVDIADGFYEDVIVYRNLDNLKKYIGDKYIQHAPAYGDGTDALVKALEKELNDSPDVEVRIHRTIAEDDYVAIHSSWGYGKEVYVFVDIWRVEDGKLVEHWDHYQKVPEKSENTNTMYLGPDVNNYIEQDKKRNIKRSLAVLATFDNLGDTSAIEKYVSDEIYIQHNPKVGDGKTAFLGYINDLKGKNFTFKTTIAKTIAMGDMVLVHSKRVETDKPDDRGTGYIDIFRFDTTGMITEHWDITEVVPEKSNNTNGIFTYPKN